MNYKLMRRTRLAACRGNGVLHDDALARGRGAGHHQGRHSAFSFGDDGHQRDDTERHGS